MKACNEFESAEIIFDQKEAIHGDGKAEVLYDTLLGQILKDRFKIEKYLDKGAYGQVFTVIDTKADASDAGKKPLVIKVNPSNELFEREVQAMIKVGKVARARSSKISNGKSNIPEVIDKGQIILVNRSELDKNNTKLELNPKSSDLLSYVIMPRLGINLQELFYQRGYRFTDEQILSLSLQILDIIEHIHSAGIIYNDLKLDNLLFDFNANVAYLKSTNDNIFENH